jgi:hypothetical protein
MDAERRCRRADQNLLRRIAGSEESRDFVGRLRCAEVSHAEPDLAGVADTLVDEGEHAIDHRRATAGAVDRHDTSV